MATTERSRVRAYAKAMAMPGIREWTRHSTGDNVFYSIEFEGREYYIERDTPGRNQWSVRFKTTPDAKERLTPSGGRIVGHFYWLGPNDRATSGSKARHFRTPGDAALAARRFAEIEGWASSAPYRRRASRRGSRRSR